MRKFLRFVKIEHTLFSLPIVLSGSFLAIEQAGRWPAPRTWVLILLAVLGARSAGFGLNRLTDADIDRENPRTRSREIPSGQISPIQAAVFIAISGALFLGSAALLSRACLLLAPIPLILFTVYPFLKRFTALAHFGLGLAWGIAPLGGWLAIDPALAPLSRLAPALLLSLFSVFWVAGFDILYALLDADFDRKRGLRSLPALLGEKDAIIVSELTHFLAFLFLGTLVQLYLHNVWAFALLAAAGLLFALSHARVATRPLTPEVIDFAFFKANAALGFVIMLIILTGVFR